MQSSNGYPVHCSAEMPNNDEDHHLKCLLECHNIELISAKFLEMRNGSSMEGPIP
jgi:hypothetical protein